MKIEKVQALFKQQTRVKLFFLTSGFCLCGYASNPRATEKGLLIDLGPSVRFSFASQEIIKEPVTSGTLIVTDSCKVTRRVQTHRRHLEQLGVPEDYLNEALTL